MLTAQHLVQNARIDVTHPFTASQIAATLATHRQGAAMQSFMVGNPPGGLTNLGLARYNTGRATGITQ